MLRWRKKMMDDTLSQEKNRQASDVKVVVISELQQQRQAFSDTVRSSGLNLVDCITKSALQERIVSDDIDLWLVDGDYDQEVINTIDEQQSNTILIGFSEAPYANEEQKYAKWQRKLRRKLAETLKIPALVESRIYDKPIRDWTHVVYLGASMGGPAAIKEFLDNLSPDLPICLLLAHHFSPQMVHTLPKIISRHNDWRCQVINATQSLKAGTCLIAPVEERIICDSYGRVFLTDESWEGKYRPSISQLFKNVSEVYGSELVGIIFSGMGNDGSLYLEEMQENDSHIWAQEPTSCTNASQPRATIESGYCQYVGTPIELAKKLTKLVSA